MGDCPFSLGDVIVCPDRRIAEVVELGEGEFTVCFNTAAAMEAISQNCGQEKWPADSPFLLLRAGKA